MVIYKTILKIVKIAIVLLNIIRILIIINLIIDQTCSKTALVYALQTNIIQLIIKMVGKLSRVMMICLIHFMVN